MRSNNLNLSEEKKKKDNYSWTRWRKQNIFFISHSCFPHENIDMRKFILFLLPSCSSLILNNLFIFIMQNRWRWWLWNSVKQKLHSWFDLKVKKTFPLKCVYMSESEIRKFEFILSFLCSSIEYYHLSSSCE